MKPAWRSFVVMLLVAWCWFPAVARAQEGPGEDDAEPEPVLTEIGARFALGSTTFRESIDDRMEGIEARTDSGYSVGAYGTLWRRGWLRLQAELLYSVRHAILAETSGRFLVSRYSLTYVELPVLTRLDIPLSGRVQPFAKLGVVPGVLVNARHSLVGDVPDGVLNELDLGVVFAAGARVPLSRSWDLTFELRGMHGVSNTFVRTPRRSSAVVASVGIGYQLGSRPDASRTLDIDTSDTLRWHARRAPAHDVERTPRRDVERALPRDAVALAGYPAGLAMAPAGMLRCDAPTSSQLVPGDAIDHVIIAGRLQTLHVHMASGRVYCYRLRPGVQVPGGTYQGSKSGRALTLTRTDGSYTTLELDHARAVQEAWRSIQAPGSFRVVVSANHVAADDLARELAARGVPRKAAERVADKVAGDRRLAVTEAEAVARVLAPGQNAGVDASWFVPFDETSWQVWMQRYGGQEDAFGPEQGDLSARTVSKLLASHKRALGIKDPPVVTAQELQQQVEQDLALLESWNGLPRWQRDLWKDYWKRYPRTNVGSDKDLSLTQDVRFRMALHMSVAHMPEGVREAARVLFNDPVFIGACAVSITLYVAAISSPEPLLSKATALAITATLLTAFSLSEIYQLASAWFRLRERAADARSLADLDAGAREFGKATGGTSLRVLVALATLFAGRALPAPRPGPTPPPTAPAVVTVSPAGTAAVARTLVAGNIRIVVLTDGTIVLPVAGGVTASSIVGGGTGSTGSTSSGATTGRGASATVGGAKTAAKATPRNAHLAGKKHPKSGVPFDSHGYPDFKAAGVVKTEVKITRTGSRAADVRAANKAAGLKKAPEGYTWHHHQDGTTMQLVPTDIHKTTGHTGGFATGNK